MTMILENSTEHQHTADGLLVGPSSSGVDVLVLDHQDRLVETLLRVGRLRNLGPGWNSYGSPPPSERIIQLVEGFITASDAVMAPFLPVPHAVPVSGGGVKLAWRNGDRELEIEFTPADEEGRVEIEYLRVSHGEPVSEGRISGTEVMDHLTWIIQE